MPEHSVRFDKSPFDDAIAHFQRKIRVPTETYRDLPGQMHAKAFMVAGAANDALLADFQESLLQAMKEGTTLSAFRDDFDRIVRGHGWQYRGSPGWRSAVIFNTNMRTSNMAGHWKRMWENRETHPYLRYVQVQRPTRRPEHTVWHGTILPIDDPWWDTHYPPNGWGCLCTAQSVSGPRMEQEGWQVTENAPAGDVPEEWAYNVGKAERVAEPLERGRFRTLDVGRNWESYGRPEKIPVDSPKASLGARVETDEEMVQAVRDMLGGQNAGTFLGPDGVRTAVMAENLGRHLRGHPERTPYIPFIPEVLEDPYEIWLQVNEDEESGRVELRRLYIKALALDKERYGWMVMEFRKGELETTTFVMSSRLKEIRARRKGVLVWARE